MSSSRREAPASPRPLSERLAALSPAQRALLDLRRGRAPGEVPAQPAPSIPRRGPRHECPLSLDQERIWFIQQLDLQSPAYNIYSGIRFRGRVEVALLARSLNEIVRRHEIMRTAFVALEGRPVQVIAPELRVAVPLVDLRALPAPVREAEAERLAADAVHRPFDLRRLPLFRTLLLRLSDDEFVCPTAFHHIITDWVSFHIFERELATLYEAFRAGRASPLPDPPIQYADYAVWQRESLGPAVLEDQLRYWREQLADAPPVLALPVDRPRPSLQSGRGRRHEIVLSRADSDGLRRLAREEEATAFMVLLAVFKAFLFRLTGQPRIVVGSPIANRRQAETEDLLGFFINQLVLCTPVSGRLGFRELLRRVREVALGAYAHQDVPFARLVEEMRLERDLSHTPLTQVVFLFLNPERYGEMRVADLSLLPYGVDGRSSKFDMTFSLWDAADGFSGWMEYNTDLFDPATVARFAEQLRRVAAAVVADPERPLETLPLLTDAQRHQLLCEWRGGVDAAPAGEVAADLFDAQVRRSPEAVALTCGGESLCFRELARRVDRLAHRLRRLGVGPEARVGLLAERSPELVVGLLAILKAGGAYVPLDPEHPPDRLALTVEDAGAAVVLGQGLLRGRLPAVGPPFVRLLDDNEWEEEDEAGLEDTRRRVGPDNPAYVIYTSGSTGRPKGVVVTHRALCNHMRWMQAAFPLGPADAVLQKTPFGFDASVWEFLAPLFAGARLVLARPGGHRDPGYLVEAIRRHGITTLQLVPSLLQALLEDGLATCSSLRDVFCGGEPLPSRLQQQFEAALGARLVNLYGPTEATIDATSWTCRRRPLPLRDTVPIGRPIAGVQVHVLDPGKQPVPIGAAGELYIGGAALGRGYLGRPDLTAASFLPDPFSTVPGARLYRTGDLVRFLTDGTLEFLGRVDHQVKVRGFRIELGEIEASLAAHRDVAGAAVLVREERPGVRRLVAYVAAGPSLLSAADLRAFLRARLPEYMVPSAFVLLERLPLTAHGKIDRASLPVPAPPRGGEGPEARPRNVREERLVRIWEEVLGRASIGIHDNFFELGGDSILSLQVMARANRAGLGLSAVHMFRHQTVAELAAAPVDGPAAAEDEAEPSGPVPLTPIQRWFFAQGFSEPGHFNQALLLEVDGDVPPAWLAAACARLEVQHDALRLRFRRERGEWVQECAAPGSRPAWSHVDLSAVPESARSRAVEAAACAAQASLDLSAGPVWRALFFALGPGTANRLLIAVHHLAIDGVSWRVLLDQLQTGVEEMRSGRVPAVPPRTTSYLRWAQRLAEFARSADLREERRYWDGVCRLPVPRLPLAGGQRPDTPAAARTVEAGLEAGDTALLQGAAQRLRASLEEVLLTALCRGYAEWSGQTSLLLDREGHGRVPLLQGLEVSQTVGWFTAIHPLRLEGDPGRPSSETLGVVKERLRAVPGGGLGYGLLRYLQPGAGEDGVADAAGPAEVSFNYLGQVDGVVPAGSPFRPARESAGLARSPRSHRPYPLEIEAFVREGRLRMRFTGDARVRDTALEPWASATLSVLRELLACSPSGQPVLVPSDFPLARLDEPSLQWLLRSAGPIEDVYPLSPAQQGMLLHTLAGAAEFNQQLSAELHGPLDAAAFERAWDCVTARHPVLRTSFAWQELARPLQVVHPFARSPLHYEDWRGLPAEEQGRRLEAFLADDRARELDLSRAPLMRRSLLRMGEEACWLVWTHHHLLMDGWSVPILLSELLTAYQAYRQGDEPTLAPVRPFRDYIEWLERQDPVAAEEYWRRELAGLPEAVPARPARGGGSGYGEESAALAAEAARRLREVARAHRLTLGTILQAAWGAVLAAETDAEEVVFGVTVSGRPPDLDGVESMVGMFINTVPVRMRIPAETPVVAWLPELQARRAESRRYEHAAVLPLWSEVAPGRPLFQSVVIFENYPAPASASGERSGLEVAGARGSVRTRYPLTLVGTPGEGLRLDLVHDRRRYPASAARRLLANLTATLEAIALRPAEALPPLGRGGAPPARPRDRRGPRTRTAARGARRGAGPADPFEETTAAIWAGLLGVKDLARDENFFAGGAHSLLALQAVSRLRDAFGVPVVLRDVFDAPTVAGLARRIRARQGTGAWQASPPVRVAGRDGEVPLGFAQEPLWRLEQALPGRALFNVGAVVHLGGVLDRAALQRSLAEIVRRQEALRTSFRTGAAGPVQVIDPPGGFALPLVDLTALPEERREHAARQLTLWEARRAFDLARGPLLRVALLRLERTEHRLLCVMHHIVSDAWSVGVFVHELAALYREFAGGRPAGLPALTVGYADFVEWQRELVRGPARAEQLGYWRRQLEGDLTSLDLPLDAPRPASPSFRTAVRSLALSAASTGALRGLARAEDASLFMVLLTGFNVLLHYLSGREDIRIGTLVANRGRPEWEGLIGLFVNTVVVRADLSGEPTYRTLLGRVREAVLGAFQHQDLPLEVVVDDLESQRGPVRDRLFDVLMIHQNTPRPRLRLPGLVVRRAEPLPELGLTPTLFDLILMVHEGARLRFELTFKTELFGDASVAGMLRGLKDILADMVRQPDRRLGPM